MGAMFGCTLRQMPLRRASDTLTPGNFVWFRDFSLHNATLLDRTGMLFKRSGFATPDLGRAR